MGIYTRSVEGCSTKRLAIGHGCYVAVPVLPKPDAVSSREWSTVRTINDQIVSQVAYDRSREGQPGRVQPPAVTMRRGHGVCQDFAALFEDSARRAGLVVHSIISDRLGHAWNEVWLGQRWWLVDVTWNAGSQISSEQALPAAVLADRDFQHRYLLLAYPQEQQLHAHGLLPAHHTTSDARIVNYPQTIEAYRIIDEIQAVIALRRQVADLGQPSGLPESPYTGQSSRISHYERRARSLYKQYCDIASRYPLAIKLTMSTVANRRYSAGPAGSGM